MTKTQLKIEIQKLLDAVPESVLQDIYNYLKVIEHQPAKKIKLVQHIRQILAEDKTLLEKLAQ